MVLNVIIRIFYVDLHKKHAKDIFLDVRSQEANICIVAYDSEWRLRFCTWCRPVEVEPVPASGVLDSEQLNYVLA